MKITDFANTGPTLRPEEYFAGSMKAWGLFQDRTGAVKRQFVVDIHGEWDGKTLILTEDFTYGGVVGQATIEVAGNAMNLRYTFDLAVGEKTYRLNFDDWMFLQPDGKRMINRAAVTKFGLRVGEVTVFFDKSEDALQAPKHIQMMQAAE